MDPVPLSFAEDRHDAIWGYERWLVSVYPSAPSVVVGGPFDGRRLDDLCDELGAGLLGTRAQGRFPLLIKEITARKNLSIQVHPDETTCKLAGGEPKAEMWHVLEAGDGGELFTGVRPGTTQGALESAIAGETVENIMQRRKAIPGENVFIPGGLIHSLGGGVSVIEIQQSSDTTYRLYDWGRVDANGHPRKLHVREGLAAARLDLMPMTSSGDFACPFFQVRVLSPQATVDLPADPETFRVLIATRGGFTLESAAGCQKIAPCGAVLVPATVSAAITPLAGDTRLLTVSMNAA